MRLIDGIEIASRTEVVDNGGGIKGIARIMWNLMFDLFLIALFFLWLDLLITSGLQ